MKSAQPAVRAGRRRHRRRPNLLFVFADQLRACDLDDGKVRTPALDRLAAGGVRVTRCFANTPVCGPSRAMLLTGTFPQRNGVLANDLPVRTDLPSLGTIARSNGYRSGYIGKWHLDGVPRTRFTPPGPRRLGFDDFWAAYNCTHDYFHPRYYRDGPELIEREGYEPQVQTDLALEFLDAARPGRGSDNPFCLVVSWGPPHDPYARVPEQYRALYDPAAIALRPNVQPETDNPLAAGLHCRRATADYFAATTALDDQLVRLLAHLDETGAADDTLVVFTSDHGDMLWSHGRMKKQAPYEESIRVPFVARLPGVLPAGRTCDDPLVGLVDVLPTLCGLLGWAVPETVHGRDGSRAMRGVRGRGSGRGRGRSAKSTGTGEADSDAVFLAEYVGCGEARRQGLPPWRGVRTRRHTYVETVGRRPWLLFDDLADPYQMDNLVDRSEHTALRDELARALGAWLERTGDPFCDGDGMLAHYDLRDAWREKQASFPE